MHLFSTISKIVETLNIYDVIVMSYDFQHFSNIHVLERCENESSFYGSNLVLIKRSPLF